MTARKKDPEKNIVDAADIIKALTSPDCGDIYSLQNVKIKGALDLSHREIGCAVIILLYEFSLEDQKSYKFIAKFNSSSSIHPPNPSCAETCFSVFDFQNCT